MILASCVSGSEAVLVPGADMVVDAPVPTVDRPTVTEPVTDDPLVEESDDTTVEVTDAAAPTSVQAPSTSAPEPTSTPASTTSPQPPDTTVAPSATDASSEDVFLRLGDESDEVGLMQFKLSVLDYLPAGSDTGVFDQATENGLRSFQADYGLGVDGVFGPLTGRALNAAAQSVAVET